MRFLEFRKRFFSATLATVVATTTMYGNVATVVAAPSDTAIGSDEYKNVKAVDNAKAASDALMAYQAALEKNNQNEIQTALEAIANLTPTQRIHLFLLIYKVYYSQAFLDANFPYFDVNEYMVRYPEVAEKYAELSGAELYQAILNDYIETGIFEGKSSCTDFDPIIALLAYPDETYDDIVSGIANPWEGLAAIFDAYVEAEGSTTTSQYQLSSDLLGDRLLLMDDEEANFNNIYLVKEPVTEATKVDILPYHADQLVNVDHSDSDDDVDDNNGSQINKDVAIPDIEENSGSTEENPGSSEEISGGTEENPGDSDNQEENSGGTEENPGSTEENPGGIEETIVYNPYNKAASTQAVGVYELYSLNPEKVDEEGKYYVNSTVKGSEHKDGSVNSNVDKTLKDGWFNVNAYNDIAGQSESGKKEVAKTTVLIYMYGTDLEENAGLVTQSVRELIEKGYNTDELNIVIATGATKNFAVEALNSSSGNYNCCYYYVDPSAYKELLENENSAGNYHKDSDVINDSTMVLLGQYGRSDFGDSSLLAGLVDMTYDLFAADNYVLVFNDHGGGINSGIGSLSDEAVDNKQTTLEMSEIEEALGGSHFYQNGNKFALIGFDACLMNGIEVAHNMSQYGDYMLACSESELNSWDYTDLINAFTSDDYINALNSEDSIEKSIAVRNAAVSLAQDSYKKHMPKSTGNIDQSFSVINLNEVKSTVDALNEVGKAFNDIIGNADNGLDSELKTQLSTDVYFAMRSARARTYSNGASDMDNLFEYVDIYDYMSRLSDAIDIVKKKWENTENGTEVVAKLENCISKVDVLLSCNPIEYEGVGFSNERVYDVDAIVQASKEGTRLTFEEIAQLMAKSPDESESKTAWEKLKGNLFCGTTIYMPYYSAQSNTDSEAGATIDDSRYIAYETQNLISEYTDLVKNYVAQKNSPEEKERLNRLKTFLLSEYTDEEDNKHSYFGDLFDKPTVSTFETASTDPSTPYTSKYISIPIRKDYVEERKAGEDSIDTYTDFKDILKEIKIYMIKSKEVAISDTETEIVDVVIGQAVVNGDAINGATEAINIVLEKHRAYVVEGIDADSEDKKSASEYVLPTTIGDLDMDISKEFGIDSDFVLFKGTAVEQKSTKQLTVYGVYTFENEAYALKGMLQQIEIDQAENGQEGTSQGESEVLDENKKYTYKAIDIENSNIASIQYDQYVMNNESGCYEYSKKATDSSTRFAFYGTSNPVIVYDSNGLSGSDYDKASVEIVMDKQVNEDGPYYSYVITDISVNEGPNENDDLETDPDSQSSDGDDSSETTNEGLTQDNDPEQEETPEIKSGKGISAKEDKNDNKPIEPVDAAPVEPTLPSEPAAQPTTGEGYSESNGESGEGDSSSNGESGEGDSSSNGENGNGESEPESSAESESAGEESTSAASAEGESSDGESTSATSAEGESSDGESTSGSSTEGESGGEESSGDASSENGGDSSGDSESSSSSSSSSESSSSSSSGSDSSSSSSSSSDSSSSSSDSGDSSSDDSGSSSDGGSSDSDDD